jgi:type IV pilus assembly protein PilO
MQIAAIVVVLGFGYSIYEFFDFRSTDVPKMEAERNAREKEMADRTAELKKLKDFANNIEVIKQELRELNLQLELALEHMPRTFNLSGLLRKLTMLAQNSGVELSSFKPKSAEVREEGTFYSTVGIEFDLRGTFTQTLVFLDQVSRLKRIVNVDSLKMDVVPNAAQRAGALVAKSAVAIRTYRFSE